MAEQNPILKKKKNQGISMVGQKTSRFRLMGQCLMHQAGLILGLRRAEFRNRLKESSMQGNSEQGLRVQATLRLQDCH